MKERIKLDPKSVENFNVEIRARAKAEVGKKTLRARVLRGVDYLARFFTEKERMQRYYCTEFRFWRACDFRRCRRARACEGNPAQCLAPFMRWVPRPVQLAARKKMMEATPLHFGAIERKVRAMMPLDFWRRRRNPLLIEHEIAEARRRREFDKTMDDSWNPYGPDGLAPVLRSRRR